MVIRFHSPEPARPLDELAKDDGEILRHANRMGERLQAGILTCARKRGIPLVIAGFGAAFAVHFTSRKN